MPDIRQLISDFGWTGLCMSRDELNDAQHLANSCATVFAGKARRLVEQCQHDPILHHYSSDATGYITRTISMGSGQEKLQRTAREYHEYLCERSFFLSRDRYGKETATVLLRPPRSLMLGKRSWHMFTSMEEHAPMLKVWGHQGIAVSAYGFDRGAMDGLHPLVFGRHQEADLRLDAARTGGEPSAVLTDWVVVTGCAAHDAQNSLKWALSSELDSDEVLKSLHNGIRSVVAAGESLHAVIPEFLRRHTKSYGAPPTEDDTRQWWMCLGVDASMLDRMVAAAPKWNHAAEVFYTTLDLDQADTFDELFFASALAEIQELHLESLVHCGQQLPLLDCSDFGGPRPADAAGEGEEAYL